MKTNFKMMALGLAIAGSAMFANAKQYCGEVLTQVVNETTYSITFTAQKLSEGVYQLLIEGEGLTGLGGSFMNVNGVGGYDIRTNMVVAGDGTSITVNINSTSDPSFHTPLYVLMPGEVNFGELYDIEWGSCGTAVEDNEAPVMGTATVGNVTHNSATIAVTATDNVGVLLYHVVDATNSLNLPVSPPLTGTSPSPAWHRTRSITSPSPPLTRRATSRPTTPPPLSPPASLFTTTSPPGSWAMLSSAMKTVASPLPLPRRAIPRWPLS